MEKTYDPNSIEQHWGTYWEQQGYYQAQATATPTYAITLPPPNVTGTLHMGHGFQMTLMDALIRKARMSGANTLWQPGTDHAGIATQMVVERELARENIKRTSLSRDDFIEKVWQWKAHSGGAITQQIRRLGASMDWQRERFSMDDDLSHATQHAFIKLYEDGLIYRGKRLVNWDPKLQTAISDLEVINKETQGSLWYIRYPLSDNSSSMVIATTRPETMLGDTAVAVHPEDSRYADLVGKSIALPLTDRLIPIIADEHVDREFGTGCVKITPAHDFNDNDMGQRHNLPAINILTENGHLNDSVPVAYQGLERFVARQQIITDLETAGLLVDTQAHTLQVPTGDRSGAVIEPMLTDQWFIKMDSLAKPAIDALTQGELKLVPAVWDKTYLQWLNNIQDWCISRQLWWGHRIPAWYDQQGNHYIGQNEADVRERYSVDPSTPLQQDEDVLDTWFTASLCPFSSLLWPQNAAELKAFYPNNVLVTGFDILFFWVARMVMMGLHFLQQVPFKEVYIHGLIRDAQGKKMSKSKGNVLDPIDLVDGIDLDSLIKKRTFALMQPKMASKVEKQTRKSFPEGIAAFGTDALRFTFCALASTGRDIVFDMGRIEGYRNFCNKLWNAARFVLMQVEGHTINNNLSLSTADQWIISQLNDTVIEVHRHFANYRFDLLAQCLYEFTWNEYCDWYLELAKCLLNDKTANEQQKNAARHTLVSVLETLLRLLHPLIPFITEEIWQNVAPLINITGNTIMQARYPEPNNAHSHDQATQRIQWLKALTTQLRNLRSEMGISPAKSIDLFLFSHDSKEPSRFQAIENTLRPLAKINNVTWAKQQADIPASAATSVDQLEIHIPMAGLVNKDEELSRLKRESNKIQKELDKCQQKLNNPNYTNKAPAEVVEKERAKLQELTYKLEKMQAYYHKIESLA